MPPSFHEDFTPQPPRAGSDRAFGLVFAGVFALVGAAPVRVWALALAVLLLGVAVLWPRGLGPFNRLWFRFGILLSSITLPVLMAVLFYGVLTPIALLRRLVGAPGLALHRDKAESYWIARKDPPGRDSLKQQF